MKKVRVWAKEVDDTCVFMGAKDVLIEIMSGSDWVAVPDELLLNLEDPDTPTEIDGCYVNEEFLFVPTIEGYETFRYVQSGLYTYPEAKVPGRFGFDNTTEKWAPDRFVIRGLLSHQR